MVSGNVSTQTAKHAMRKRNEFLHANYQHRDRSKLRSLSLSHVNETLKANPDIETFTFLHYITIWQLAKNKKAGARSIHQFAISPMP